ncbi:MAG: hypothetical protein ACQESB_00140 [Elusimicrobiota bacterium]
MKEKLLKQIYDKVDNQWLFIVRASEKYDQEFKKTAKIGQPPKIEDILEKMFSAENKDYGNAKDIDPDKEGESEEGKEEKESKK